MTMVANRQKAFEQIRNRRGMATVESIPLLIVFVMLSGYAMGLWGSVHSAILNSISARTYAFETFRNRTNLIIFREDSKVTSKTEVLTYAKKGMRYHSVGTEAGSRLEFVVARQPLSVGYPAPLIEDRQQDHLTKIYEMQERNQSVGVGHIWMMVGYGMCLDAACGL